MLVADDRERGLMIVMALLDDGLSAYDENPGGNRTPAILERETADGP